MWFIEKHADIATVGINMREKLHEEQTEFQKLEVYVSDYFGKILTLDDCMMFSDKDEFIYHEMMAHMPLCTYQNPEKVLVIGGGDGGVVREVLKHPSVKEVVLCEIDRRVVEVCKEYFPQIAGKLNDSKVKIVYQDGTKFLADYQNYFDVILTDSTDPIGPAVELFHANYFKLVKKALKPDGIMVSQSESPWLFHEPLIDMTNALRQQFQNVQTYIAMIPLYGLGFWTFTFASDNYSLYNFNLERSNKIAESCQYYSPDIHKAALAMPRFARDIIELGIRG